MKERFFEKINKLSKIILLSGAGVSFINVVLGYNGILNYQKYQEDSAMYHVSNITTAAFYGTINKIFHPLDAVTELNLPNKEYFDNHN